MDLSEHMAVGQRFEWGTVSPEEEKKENFKFQISMIISCDPIDNRNSVPQLPAYTDYQIPIGASRRLPFGLYLFEDNAVQQLIDLNIF
jgi:hypothetical protein